jgi:putative tricarboxylic transport membrane protein
MSAVPPAEKRMKRGWQAASISFLIIFGWFGYESLQLSLSDAIGPGPGFFPFWLSVAGGVFAAALLTQVSAGRGDVAEGMLAVDRAGMHSIVLTLAGLAIATALLDVAGFRLCMLVLIAYLLVVLGVRNWFAVSGCAVAGSFGVYHVFFDLLKVPLPVGVLGL